MQTKFEIRILEMIETADRTPCWPYWGKLRPDGYARTGLFRAGRRINMPAHRHAYEMLSGEIVAAGFHCDHLCRNPACVNPFHIEVVTPRENQRRGVGTAISKTHCKNGHPFAGDNVRWEQAKLPGRSPKRRCRTCAREMKRRKNGFPKKRQPRPRRSACTNGHPLTGDNAYSYLAGGRTYYGCRACRKAKSAAWFAAKQAEKNAGRDEEDRQRQAQLAAAGNTRTKRQTHCKRGHLLSGENVRWGTKGGHVIRCCRACKTESAARQTHSVTS
jgi:hypothetical protein